MSRRQSPGAPEKITPMIYNQIIEFAMKGYSKSKICEELSITKYLFNKFLNGEGVYRKYILTIKHSSLIERLNTTERLNRSKRLSSNANLIFNDDVINQMTLLVVNKKFIKTEVCDELGIKIKTLRLFLRGDGVYKSLIKTDIHKQLVLKFKENEKKRREKTKQKKLKNKEKERKLFKITESKDVIKNDFCISENQPDTKFIIYQLIGKILNTNLFLSEIDKHLMKIDQLNCNYNLIDNSIQLINDAALIVFNLLNGQKDIEAIKLELLK